jgi:hypothetical protein
MILRRLSKNLREQNWTAITIEFVLLVIGVFLGIQVANWNEERTQRLQERSFLAQLRDEIAGNDEGIEHQLRYLGQVIAGGRRALDYLQSGEDCESGCEALLIDFFHASQIWGSPFARAKYEETQRLGFPSSPSTRAAVDEFYDFIGGWDTVTASAPPYREHVRGHFTPAAAEVLWRECWHSPSARFEELRRDCEEGLKQLDTAAMLGAIRADVGLRTELRFWLGQNIFAARAFPQARRHAQAATTAISRELEGHQ